MTFGKRKPPFCPFFLISHLHSFVITIDNFIDCFSWLFNRFSINPDLSSQIVSTGDSHAHSSENNDEDDDKYSEPEEGSLQLDSGATDGRLEQRLVMET